MLWTTIPPAKSSTPHRWRTPPPQIMWTNGKYTNRSHAVKKTMYALKVTRLAKAPVIRAGVMIANIIWYATNTISGIDGLSADGLERDTPLRNALSRFPMIPAVSPEKHRE